MAFHLCHLLMSHQPSNGSPWHRSVAYLLNSLEAEVLSVAGYALVQAPCSQEQLFSSCLGGCLARDLKVRSLECLADVDHHCPLVEESRYKGYLCFPCTEQLWDYYSPGSDSPIPSDDLHCLLWNLEQGCLCQTVVNAQIIKKQQQHYVTSYNEVLGLSG